MMVLCCSRKLKVAIIYLKSDSSARVPSKSEKKQRELAISCMISKSLRSNLFTIYNQV